MIWLIAFFDSTLTGVPRPVDIYVDNDGRIYVLSLNGKIWVYDDLDDTPRIYMKGLSQPALEMEFLGDTVFVMHGRYLDAFFPSGRLRIVNFVPLTGNNSTFTLDTVRGYIYMALEGIWQFRFAGRVFRLDIDGRNLYAYSAGFRRPVAIDVDSVGVPWIISEVGDGVYGLYPVYEGLNYVNLEPLIYFSSRPTDLQIWGNGFLISFDEGEVILYRRFRGEIYEREVLLRTPYEISSIFLRGDSIYFSDYVSGRIYVGRLKLLEANR